MNTQMGYTLKFIITVFLLFNSNLVFSQTNVSYIPFKTNSDISNNTIIQNLAVGSTSGGANVVNGALNYQIPILVPPRPLGAIPAPEISIVYNSLGSDGMLGRGWNISGVSSIHRTSKSISFDDVTEPSCTVNDVFIWDGQRLFKNNPNAISVVEFWHTENESFAEIKSIRDNNGNISEWEIKLKTGEKYLYGTHATLFAINSSSNNLGCNQSNGAYVGYYLNNIVFPNGNTRTYHYDASNDNYPCIDWISDIYGTVSFQYKNRIDNNKVYLNGKMYKKERLLDKIVVENVNGSILRKYNFKYSTDNINSFLSEVQEESGNGNLLNPTIFKYGNAGEEIFVKDQIASAFQKDPGHQYEFVTGDYNNDGKSDYLVIDYEFVSSIDDYKAIKFDVYVNTSLNTTNAVSFSKTYSQSFSNSMISPRLGVRKRNSREHKNFSKSDYNGDGLEDFMFYSLYYNTSQNNLQFQYIKIYYSNGDGSFTDETKYIQDMGMESEYCDVGFYNLIEGDFDGDAGTDFILITNENNSHYTYVCYPKKNIYGAQVATNGLGSLQIQYQNSYAPLYNFFSSMDFDGDGRDELVINDKDKTRLYSLYETNHMKLIYSKSLVNSEVGDRLFVGDFNGDGKSDLIKFWYNSTNANILYSDGNNFNSQNLTLTYPFDYNGGYPNGTFCSDFNGDGKTDIIQHSTSNYLNYDLYYSTGMNFFKKQYTFEAFPFSFIVGDFNGDGNSDIYSCDVSANSQPYTPNQKVIFFNYESQNLLMTNIKNGFGATIDLSYANMTSTNPSNSFYSKSYTGSAYSTNPLKYKEFYYFQKPLYLVRQFNQWTSSGLVANTYKYKGAVFNNQGRGFLGFREIEILDNVRGVRMNIQTNTDVNSQFNECLVVNRTESVKVSTNAIINQTNSQFFKFGIGPRNYYIKNITSETYDYLKGNFRVSNNFQYPTGELISVTTENLINNNKEIKTINYGNNIGLRPAYPTSVNASYYRTGQPTLSKTTNYEYNNLFQLTKDIQYVGLPKTITNEYEYNSTGLLTKQKVTGTGMAPRTTEIIYDNYWQLFVWKQKNELGQETIYDMNQLFNVPNSITGSDGLVTYYEYDDWGRRVKTTLQNGKVINESIQWDQTLNLTNCFPSVYKTISSSVGSQTEINYVDKYGRVFASREQIANGDLPLTYSSINNRGNKIEKISLDNSNQFISKTTIEYDDYDRIIRTKLFNSISNSIILAENTYVKNGNFWEYTTSIPASASNSSGKTIFKKTTLDGELVESNENGVNTLYYDYNALGKNIKIISNGNIISEMKYDEYGNQISLEDNSAGLQTYEYNALGELTKQQNPNNGFINFEYDNFGRKVKKVINEGTVVYSYFPLSGVPLYKAGKLQKIQGYSNGDFEEYDYDNLGRLVKIDKKIYTRPGGALFTTEYLYDNNNQIIQKKSPTGNVYNYSYNSIGFLTNISKGSTSIYSLGSVNPSGRILSYYLANHLATNSYNSYGQLNSIFQPSYINDEYEWDEVNQNLISKKEKIKNFEYSYSYDNFERLTNENLIGNAQNSLEFADNGNIISKFSAGNYDYHTGKQFAVKTVDHGDEYSQSKQEIKYNSFNKPTQIKQGLYTLNYYYDHNFDRSRASFYKNNNVEYLRFYAGASEYTYDKNGNFQNSIDYIYAGDQLVAMDVTESTIPSKLWYVQTDYQGSIRAVCDNNGTIFHLNYDAWGVPRMSNSGALVHNSKPTGLPDWLYRGYIGQEHLYEFGLINLNARLYDPHNSRMLSPDNFVSESSLQGFNRYTYCNNNPLKYSDPTGNYAGWDDATAVILGGLFNVATNLDNINGVGSAGGYFAVGAAAGEATLYLGPAAGGAILGAGNQITKSAIKGEDINMGEAIFEGIKGAVTSVATAGMSKVISPITERIVSKIVNPIVKKAIDNGVIGLVTGSILGGFGAALNGQDILKGAVEGGRIGLAMGLISGSVQGIREARVSTNKSTNPSTDKETGNSDIIAEQKSQSAESNSTTSYEKGLQGLKENNIVQNTERIPSVNGTASFRVPDEMYVLGEGTTIIGEVKNYAVGRKLGLTSQIKDFIDYAVGQKAEFRLYIRTHTQLTQPLIDYINSASYYTNITIITF